jgi:hypothetical protein
MEFEDELTDCGDELGAWVISVRLSGRIHPSCPLAQAPLLQPALLQTTGLAWAE